MGQNKLEKEQEDALSLINETKGCAVFDPGKNSGSINPAYHYIGDNPFIQGDLNKKTALPDSGNFFRTQDGRAFELNNIMELVTRLEKKIDNLELSNASLHEKLDNHIKYEKRKRLGS